MASGNAELAAVLRDSGKGATSEISSVNRQSARDLGYASIVIARSYSFDCDAIGSWTGIDVAIVQALSG